MPGKQVVIKRDEAQPAVDHPIGEPVETGSVGAFLKSVLWEMLAIGLVGLTTYLSVSLIIWFTSLLN